MDEGKGILIITYAIDLYVIPIPLKVKKYNSLKFVLNIEVIML